MCVGEWSRLGYVKNSDIKVAASLPEIEGDKEELSEDWDIINL
jgi:hypothetical protein